MTKDEVKSLVNSVNMIKNMVESIVAAVQERFKDYDDVVVSLKERIQNLEERAGSEQTITAPTAGSFEQITKLEKRLDSLNERILLIEAARSVHQEAAVEPTEVQAFKDVAVKETQPEVKPEVQPKTVVMPEAPVAPPPAPEIISPEPETTPTPEPIPPTVDAPSIPTPTPPPATRIPEPETTPIPEPETTPTPTTTAPTSDIPAPSAIPKPATQVTETGERDVSPISKEVSGAIPAPPSQTDAIPTTDTFQPPVTKEDSEPIAPEEKKSAELFGEAVSGDKAELLKALKKLEDL
jgi:hypothetical protein